MDEDERVVRAAEGATPGPWSVRDLAELEAKRRILEAHDRPEHYCPVPVLPSVAGQLWEDGQPCWTLLALAQPYAGRTGFKDEWRLT